jgi:hypothetical protein
MAVPMDLDTLKVGAGAPVALAETPRVLFEGSFMLSQSGATSYDTSKDGQRFLRVQAVKPEPPPTQINIVLNWFNELQHPARR